MDTVYDVMVLGGGVMGAATAEFLASYYKQKVLLLERFEPAHENGSSHGNGRIFRLGYPEPLYVDMAQRSHQVWGGLTQRAGEPLMRMTGNWSHGPENSIHINELAETLEKLDVPFERLTFNENYERFPQFYVKPGSNTDMLFEPTGGVLFASRIVQVLWQLAKNVGVETAVNTQVAHLDVAGDGMITVTAVNGQKWRGKKLVVTAGAWSKKILQMVDLIIPLIVTQEQVAYFFPSFTAMDHKLDQMPTFVDYQTEQPFYGLPEGGLVKVGWHHTGPVIDPDEPRLPIDPYNLERVQGYVAEYLPYLQNKPFRVSHCLYSNTPDFHFILDKHPQYPNIVIGAGFSGHGFKFAPIISRILAALALDKKPPVPLEQFSLARFKNPFGISRRSGA